MHGKNSLALPRDQTRTALTTLDPCPGKLDVRMGSGCLPIHLMSLLQVFGSLWGGTFLKARLPEAWGQRGLRLRQAGKVFQQHVLSCGDSVQTLIVTLCSIASRPVW